VAAPYNLKDMETIVRETRISGRLFICGVKALKVAPGTGTMSGSSGLVVGHHTTIIIIVITITIISITTYSFRFGERVPVENPLLMRLLLHK